VKRERYEPHPKLHPDEWIIKIGPLWLHNWEQFGKACFPMIAAHWHTENGSRRLFAWGHRVVGF
jgi:hypothetical protein